MTVAGKLRRWMPGRWRDEEQEHCHDHDASPHGGPCAHSHPHDHEHEHDEKPPPPSHRPAEDGGPACQLDLNGLLPGQPHGGGRFGRLEDILSAQAGIKDVHLREDNGRPEVCVHYDDKLVAATDVVLSVRQASAGVNRRYRHVAWLVRGMDSPQCGFTIEERLSRMSGVLSASVAYSTERLVVEYDRDRTSERDIEAGVASLGYRLEPVEPEHAHAHGAPRAALPLSLVSGLLLGIGFAVESLGMGPHFLPTAFYVAALICGGIFPARDVLSSLRELHFDIETLMVAAALGAGFLGAWFEGAFLLFLFSVGNALERRAMERARNAIAALARLRPETARVHRQGAVVELPVGEVVAGDVVVVRAGDRVPVDGTLKEGTSSFDQSAITGESIPVPRGPGQDVLAGTINVESAVEMEVKRLANQSMLARIIEMVAEAEARKSPTQRFTQKVERVFVPLIMLATPLMAAVLMLMGTSGMEALLRSISLLVAASPCALAISTPSAVLSAVARAAQMGVLMKGGAHLEALGKVNAIAFDKTGTLTTGKPRLTSVVPAEGVDASLLLATAAGAEQMVCHPLAIAVVNGARERNINPADTCGCMPIGGKGVQSRLGNDTVWVGSPDLFEGQLLPRALVEEVTRLQDQGQTAMLVKLGDRFLGVLGVADTVRAGAREALDALRAMGLTRTVMLSGDNERAARAVAQQVGIDEPRAPLMPDEKVAVLREMAREGGVAMVGDGVNDAPALAAASVGVAMGGAGSDVALETADIVLMGDDLRRLPFAVGLARQATSIIRQNLVISLGVSGVLVVAAILGWVRVAEAVVLHEGSTVLVVLNALRLLGYARRA